MWLFKRTGKEIKTGVPTEASTQPMWLIWLLSAGTFVVTVLIVLGLFAGGRWVLHRATNKSTPVAKAPSTSKPQGASGISPVPSGASAPKANPTPTPAPTTPTPKPTPTPATTPSTGPSNLVNTGPTSDD